MKLTRPIALTLVGAAALVGLAACGSPDEPPAAGTAASSAPAASTTVTSVTLDPVEGQAEILCDTWDSVPREQAAVAWHTTQANVQIADAVRKRCPSLAAVLDAAYETTTTVAPTTTTPPAPAVPPRTMAAKRYKAAEIGQGTWEVDHPQGKTVACKTYDAKGDLVDIDQGEGFAICTVDASTFAVEFDTYSQGSTVTVQQVTR
jgi:hypothetical protein